MALATQCPHCYTSFRVANDQLKLYAGMVRCGACKQTFNGIEHLIPPGSTPKLAPVALPAADATAPVIEEPSDAPVPEQEKNTQESVAEADDHHTNDLDLDNNLRALLEEIKVRQEEEDVAKSHDTSGYEVNANAITDRTAEEAVSFLEIIETEDQAHEEQTNTSTPKSLTASIDFELNEGGIDNSTATPSVKMQLAPHEIEELKSLESAIESEIDLYGDANESDSITNKEAAITFNTDLQPANLSPEIDETPHTDIEADLTTENTPEETPDFVLRAQKKQRHGKWTSFALAFGILLCLIGATGQASYFFRNAIAAEYPQTKPHLLQFCRLAKCEIKLPAQRSQLEISGSELQILTNDPLVNELNFQIQNKGKSAQSWPHLELILKDTRGKTVLQKAVSPTVYLENKALLATGIPANSESAHKLNFELAIPKASSYTIELFYP